ncbi:MAG: hypothetical protein QXN55_06395, partial [Candidatus Nitrosotenuis sp.]
MTQKNNKKMDRKITKFTGPSPKIKNRVISFRLPEDIVEDIENEASKGGLTTNGLVREVLIKYARWDIFASKIGLIPFPKEFLSLLLKDITQEKIEEFSEIFYQHFKDWALYSKGKYGLKQCIETLEDYMKASGVESDHRVYGDEHKYIIRHNLGLQWSFFGANLLKNLFNDFAPQKKMEFTTTTL